MSAPTPVRQQRRSLAAFAAAGAMWPCLLALIALPLRAFGDDCCERDALTGDWGGTRTAVAGQGIELQAVYTGDVFATLAGGLRRRAVYLANVDLTLQYDLPDVFGVHPGTVFAYGLSTLGSDPSRDIGDAQGADNIEAPDGIKLYEAWWQRSFLSHRLSLLAGLYDLNSEFDVIESAALFINSSFGVGPDLSQSGANGPSIFPATALGVRVSVSPMEQFIVQAAVFDGVPGGPDNAGGTEIHLRSDDGLLAAFEAAFILPHPGPSLAPRLLPVDGHGRRRLGRGWEPLGYAFKVALGTWFYTARFDDLERVDAAGTPLRERAHPGVYGLVDASAYHEPGNPYQGLSVFARLGLADPDVVQFAGYAGGGMVYTGLFPGRDADQLGVGVAAALNGRPFKRAGAGGGSRPAGEEVALEWTYRAAATPWLALQPDIQYVIHPGGISDHGNALVLGLRTEVTF